MSGIMIYAILTLTNPQGYTDKLIAYLTPTGIELCQDQAKAFNATTPKQDAGYVFKCEVGRPA